MGPVGPDFASRLPFCRPGNGMLRVRVISARSHGHAGRVMLGPAEQSEMLCNARVYNDPRVGRKRSPIGTRHKDPLTDPKLACRSLRRHCLAGACLHTTISATSNPVLASLWVSPPGMRVDLPGDPVKRCASITFYRAPYSFAVYSRLPHFLTFLVWAVVVVWFSAVSRQSRGLRQPATACRSSGTSSSARG
jgi:hypothetical protein